MRNAHRFLYGLALLSLCIVNSPVDAQQPPATNAPRVQATDKPKPANSQSNPKESETRGKGGELHQTASGDQPTLTTQQGIPVSDDQNSLKVGATGPTLLEDFHFREKMFHFDHERIPERVVHARGFGVHGYYENYESLAEITKANLFQKAGEKTPAFVRFSTVAGSLGSPDLARDVRASQSSFTHKKAIGTWLVTTFRCSSSKMQSSSRPYSCCQTRARSWLSSSSNGA